MAPVELLTVVFWKSTRGLQCTVCINLTNKYNTYSGKFEVNSVDTQSHVSQMKPFLDVVRRVSHLIWTWEVDVVFLEFQNGVNDSAKFNL